MRNHLLSLRHLLLLLFMLIASMSAQAKDQVEGAYSFIIYLVEGRVQPGMEQHEFSLIAIEVILESGRSRNGPRRLSLIEVEERDKQLKRQARKHQLGEALRYDYNFDAKVTREEIIQGIADRSLGDMSLESAEKSSLLRSFMVLDTNEDNVLTYKEMSAPSEKTDTGYGGIHANGTTRYASEYRKLDSNKDNYITPDEILSGSLIAFGTLDTDGNSILSIEELAAYEGAAGKIGRRRWSDQRGSPRVPHIQY